MIKIICLLFIAFLCQNAISQDPEIIDTWFFRNFTYDLGDSIYLEASDAPQNPYIIINSDYSFEGLAACNTFSGNFDFDPVENVYNILNFSQSNDDCNNTNYNDFEEGFFNHFTDTPFFRVDFGGGNLYLEMESPGFGMEFQDTPFLGILDISLQSISISPNPALNILYIEPQNFEIKKFSVYNLSGQKIIQLTNLDNSLDVSSLLSGIYFLEINASEGTTIKKLVKK